MRPADRLGRLLRHVRAGWQRVRASDEERANALRWLGDHPSAWKRVDELWSEALSGDGPLARWLDLDSAPESWTLDIPLHSVLASHPFVCQSPWSIPDKSIRS